MAAVFRTSISGRFGHSAFALLGLILASLFGLPVLLGGISADNFWYALGALAICALGLYGATYSIWFAVAPGKRITCSREQLTYRGILKSVTISWADIASIRLHFGGRSPFVFLLIRCKDPKRRAKLNLSGLAPGHEALVALIRRLAPSIVVEAPTGYGIAEAIAEKLANEL